MIHAKTHELKKMFNQHYSCYNSNVLSATNSKRLLLFYAVECGLKALILEKIGGRTTEYFNKYAPLKGKLDGKKGHDIKEMLHFLGYAPIKLPDLPCKTGDKASATEYNQIWRYGISVDEGTEVQIETELKKIVKWINGRV